MAGYSPNESGFAAWMQENGYRQPIRREEYDHRQQEYQKYLASGGRTAGSPESAPEPVQPTTPDAQDLSKSQMAAQQAAPEADQASTDGEETLSRKRRGRATGKKTLSVRRASGSGLNV